MKTTLVALNAHFMHTNLALRQIMPKLGAFDVRIVEGHINLPHRRLLGDIAQGAPDVIGFSCYIWNIAHVLRLCRALEQALPDTAIFLAGPEVEHCPEAVLSAHPQVAFVLSGEGEQTLPALLHALQADAPLSDVPGLSYRACGGMRVNPRPSPLPPERWPNPYEAGIAGLQQRLLYIETSRGCPFRCAFCLSGAGAPVRALEADEAIPRLTALADAGARTIKLVDRTFNFDRARANRIWRALIEHQRATGHKATYHFEIGAHLLDEEALALLKQAPLGLFQFEVGIQSTDPMVLANVRRDADFPAIAQAVRAVHALGTIHLHVDLIAALPGDDLTKFARSFDEVFALGADKLQLGFLKLIPGSALREDAGQLGIRYEPDAPYEVTRTPTMDFAQLCFLKDVEQVLDWYHNSGRYRCSLRYLLMESAPFALFSHLAHALREAGTLSVEQGERARAQALLSCFDSPMLRALLRHDLLQCGRRRDLPESLAFMEDEAERALLRERFRPVRGQSAYTYPYDVLAFAAGGALVERRALVIYDAVPGR